MSTIRGEVRTYLDINMDADPRTARKPVPPSKLKELANFAKWLFGTEAVEPIVSDSRQVDEFGRILESQTAVEYLERNETPSFAVARRLAGVGACNTGMLPDGEGERPEGR